jgi:Mg-chelatase subunit ChlD
LEPDAVRPSIELLHTLLSLAGGLPETQLGRLRPLVARLVADLTARLATQLRPALAGLTSPRPTRRNAGSLDLRATVQANLRTPVRLPDGGLTVAPRQPRFRSRARRSLDWRLILVVDVSGSMEASTIWSAMTSAVLSGLPALTTHFVTFSTQVIDLTGYADDPLNLLLEVSVGGGTHIAAGLAYARSLMTVPSRTMVVVVSDFEEGFPIAGLLAEVRTLAESGCRLIGCASLDDKAQPRYAVGIAEQLVSAGMPIAALSPLALAHWVAEQVR